MAPPRAEPSTEWTYYLLTRRRRVRLITGIPSEVLPSFGSTPRADPQAPESSLAHVH